MKLATAAAMASLDQLAVERGVPVRTLMENAGRCVAEAAALFLGALGGMRVILVCGKGNNGGDGFVAARLLLERGARPAVLLAGRVGDLKGAAREACDAAAVAGVDIRSLEDAAAFPLLRELCAPADLVVDALLGTGFQPPVRGLAAQVIGAVNALDVPVLAVDIPSGLSADHPRLEGDTVAAAATVTFALPKPGLVSYPAAARVGRLWVGDIGLPPGTTDALAPRDQLVTPADLAPWFAPRDPDGHKGTFGHVLLVAGSRGLAGAAALAARGALRAGAGLLTLALPESLASPVLEGLAEAMLLPLPECAPGIAARTACEVILPALAGKDVVALGPGLSRHPETAVFVRELISRVTAPLVVDADALAAFTGEAPHRPGKGTELILTPHPGELARLLGRSARDIQERRVESAREAATRLGAIVVLKGARTVIATPGGETWVNPTGTPALAAGGMGDVLTGAIAAHLARGIPALPAALLGVYLHGLAGERLAAARGPWGLLAGEVADELPAAAGNLLRRIANDARPAHGLSLLIP